MALCAAKVIFFRFLLPSSEELNVRYRDLSSYNDKAILGEKERRMTKLKSLHMKYKFCKGVCAKVPKANRHILFLQILALIKNSLP